jgi:hypothetical protein
MPTPTGVSAITLFMVVLKLSILRKTRIKAKRFFHNVLKCAYYYAFYTISKKIYVSTDKCRIIILNTNKNNYFFNRSGTKFCTTVMASEAMTYQCTLPLFAFFAFPWLKNTKLSSIFV